MIRTLSVWSTTLALGTVAAATRPGIDRVAPANSVFIASIDNVELTRSRLKETPLWALWESEQVQELLKDPLEECRTEMNRMLAELGLEEDVLVGPKGPVGLAVFPGPADQFEPSPPGFLVMADFGANAFKFSRVVDAMITKIDEDDTIEYRQNEVLGRTVYSFDLSAVKLDDAVAFEKPQLEQMPPMMPMPDPMEMVGEISTLHYVRDGNRFLVGSEMSALRDALEVLEGEEGPALRDREDFRTARRQLGESDAWAMLLTRDLPGLMGGADPTALMVQSLVQTLLGDIRALGFGVRLDGPASMVEETFAVYMPNGPGGLTALMDTELPRRDLPPFVGPDAIGYSALNFEFAGIMDFLRSVGRSNPMLAPQINELLFEHGAMIQQVCAALGPEVHGVVTLSRPIDLSSLKSLYAIRSSQPDQVEAVLAQHAPQIGLQPRDFLGHRIYTLPMNPLMMGMGGPMMGAPGGESFSIGFGGGYVMVGNTSLVEDALRVAGQAGVPTLADDPGYRRAMQALTEPRTVAWGVVDLVDYLDFFKDFNTMVQKEMVEQMKQWNPEFAQELQAELDAEPEMPWKDFDLDVLREHIGLLSWQVRAEEDGFVGKYYMLAPEGGEE